MSIYLTAYERMQDFIRRHKQHNINAVYQSMQIRSPVLHNLGVPVQVFYPSSDIIEISQFIQLQQMKGVINNTTLFNNASAEALYTLEHFWGLHLFGSWRNTLGIYRIDDAIFDDVIQSAIPDDTPTDIFKNLLEWSVYVQFSHPISFIANDIESSADGFWATFDCRLQNNKPKLMLNIVPNLTYFNDDTLDTLSYRQLQPISFYIDECLTIKESVERHVKENERLNPDPLATHRIIKTDYQMLTHFLSCLLLLCVDKPDVSKITGEPISKSELNAPKHKINKKTGAFIPPDKPFVYEIGSRLGGEIRKKQAEIEQGLSDGTRSMRPHIRRGHWHGYWKGTGQNKQFDVRWQPAIFVGMNN